MEEGTPQSTFLTYAKPWVPSPALQKKKKEERDSKQDMMQGDMHEG
jgi:hypothetical protein